MKTKVRTCEVCGAGLPPIEGRGQPPKYCSQEDTGRPCSRLARALRSIEAYARDITNQGRASNDARLKVGGLVMAVGSDIKYNRN